MPFIDATQNERLPFFFNVSTSVGARGVNAFHDVLLVKYLLKRVSERSKTMANVAVPINGIGFDRATISAIRTFQEKSKASGFNIVVDGRVDRSRLLLDNTTALKFIPTIISLNLAFRQFFPEFADDLSLDPRVPVALLAALKSAARVETAPESNPLSEGAPESSSMIEIGFN